MKKTCLLFIVMLFVSLSLSAIGFGYHILEVRTTPQFGSDIFADKNEHMEFGIFPSSLLYQFNFPVPDFIPGSKTELAFRLDNGLVYRNLRQDPDSGELLARNPVEYPTTYTVHFDEFNLLFGQGFFNTSFSENDLITLWVSVDGRFEYAYERLSWMSGPNEREGLFWTIADGKRVKRFDDSVSWIGAPELEGNRQSFQTSLSFGLEFDLMRDFITRRDGVKLSSFVRWRPEWLVLNGLSDDSGLYLLSWNELKLSKTLVSVKQNDPRNLSWFSIVFDNSTIYRYIQGEKVPAYIQGGNIWGTSVPNSEHVITNRLSLSIYGPQINSRDCYPYITGFWDIGYSFGNVLNRAVDEKISEVAGSIGFRAGFMIFNVAEVFFEYGYIYDPVLNESSADGFKSSDYKFGITVGI